MRNIIMVCLLSLAATVWAKDAAPQQGIAGTLQGTVLEIKDAESYSYLRLKTKEGETWAAVGRAPLKAGDQVTIENAFMMTNFESKALKRTFPAIVFGNLAGEPGAAAGGMAKPHGSAAMPTPMEGDIKVPRAKGSDAHTVAEVLTRGPQLKDKTVTVRAKVVKYNPGIMGKNWVHLRDGSGSGDDSTNDLLVTTSDATQVGAVVVAKGTVRTDRDFGAGYAYKVLVEDAKLQP